MSDHEHPRRWRNFSTTSPITACRLRRGDMKRLYGLINERQVEYGKTVLDQLAQQPNESPEQFNARKTSVARAFVTTVSVTGANGEVVTGDEEKFLDSINIPEKILTVFYSTVTGPSVVLPGFIQQSKATVLSDFSRPAVLDFTRFPTLPTPNDSNFMVASNSESWFTALNSRLTQFFMERRTRYDWLHRPGIYDLLLFFLAVPLALWIDYRIGSWKLLQATSRIIQSSVYVYLFFFGLYIYRILFTYSRWVFPKVEIHTDGSSPLGHRTAWATVMLGIVSGFLWDAIKAMW
jgi:hypothetical protein